MTVYARCLLYLLILFWLTGCMNNGKTSEGVAIECKIQNPLHSSNIYIGDRFNFRKAEVDTSSQTLLWQRDSVVGPLLVSAYFDRNQNCCIYLEPGDRLKLEFNGREIQNSLNSLTFEGGRKIENEFLISLKKVFNKNLSYEFDFYNCPEREFMERIDSLRDHGLDMINSYTKEHTGKLDFENFTREYINYTCALYLNNYPMKYRYTFGHRDYRISNALKIKIEEYVQLERPDLVDHIVYAEFLLERISGLSGLNELNFRETNELKIEKTVAEAMDVIDSLMVNQEIIKLAKYGIIHREMYLKRPAIEPFYVAFREEYPNSIYTIKLQEAWKDYKILSKGFPAPQFEFADVTGQKYSLDSFRGKWIYMDVWATWCGPCLAQQPRFEELVEKYRNNDRLLFLGISVDEDVEAWKRMVVEKKMGGVQLNIQSDPDNTFHKDYMITGVPKYLFIDPNGLVYDINTKRPKDPELVDEIDYLLSRSFNIH